MSGSWSSKRIGLRHVLGETAYGIRQFLRRSGGWGTTTQVVALVAATLAASILILSLLHVRARVDSAYDERSQFTARQARSIERFIKLADGDFRSAQSLDQIQRLSEYIGVIGGPSSFLFLDTDGIVLAHSNPARIGERYMNNGLARTLAGSGLVVEMNKDTRTDRLSLEVAAPVRHRGTVVGAVASRFPLESLDDDLAASRQDATLSALIVALIFVPAAGLVVGRFQRNLEHTAITDGLSGLYSNGYFRKRLDQEVKRSLRYGKEFSLIMLDIDDFKAHNDIHGHLVGDAAIQSVSQVLKAAIREVDIAARYGGEEFAIMLIQAGSEQAFVVSERIREGVRVSTHGTGYPLTISLGIASCPSDANTTDELIQCADVALYYAKRTGKNRSCLFSRMP